MRFNFIKKYYSVIILIIVFVGGLYLVFNAVSYIDPGTGCRIKIKKDIIVGNRSTIKQALRLIKQESPLAYQDVCNYVDVISEKYCTVADPSVEYETAQEGWEQPGCYVKGSKYIYLKAESSDSIETVKNRAQAIIKYSQFSKGFWLK